MGMKKEVVEMMGKTYGSVRDGKIVVMFYGEIGSICVMVKSRVKLLEVLEYVFIIIICDIIDVL